MGRGWVGAGGGRAPRNVILLIGDGMGFEQVKAASLYATGSEGRLAFERFYRGEATTHSLDSHMGYHATDSAAAATALATGHKTKNGMLSRDLDCRKYLTILEYLGAQGKRTGLVTTVPVTHATPAGFGAHVEDRGNWERVAAEYFERTRPNVVFGAYEGSAKDAMVQEAQAAGYAVATDRESLAPIVREAEDAAAEGTAGPEHVLGLFASGQLPWEYDDAMAWMWTDPETQSKAVSYQTVPHLSEMTAAALKILKTGPEGFFLMVEGGAIDKAGHANRLDRLIPEVLEFDKAFQTVMNWCRDAGTRWSSSRPTTRRGACGSARAAVRAIARRSSGARGGTRA